MQLFFLIIAIMNIRKENEIIFGKCLMKSTVDIRQVVDNFLMLKNPKLTFISLNFNFDLFAGNRLRLLQKHSLVKYHSLQWNHTWARGGREGGGGCAPPDGQKQVSSPVTEKWVFITKNP